MNSMKQKGFLMTFAVQFIIGSLVLILLAGVILGIIQLMFPEFYVKLTVYLVGSELFTTTNLFIIIGVAILFLGISPRKATARKKSKMVFGV